MATKPASVADVMKTDPVVINVAASLEEADVVLRSTFVTGVPIVDEDGRLVGTISHAHLAAFRFAHPRPSSNAPTGSEPGADLASPTGRDER